MRSLEAVLLATFFLSTLTVAQEGEGGSEILLSTWLSKTAIQVGDVFEYRIVVRHPDGTSFVTEELERTLLLHPFELLELRVNRRKVKEGNFLDIILILASYDKPGKLEIPSFRLFYYPSRSLPQFEKDQLAGNNVNARELVVPPQPIIMQSVLLGERDNLRDAPEVLTFPRTHLIVPITGGGLLLLLAAWVTFVGTRYLRDLRQDRKVVDKEQLLREALLSLHDLHQRSFANGQECTLYLEISKVLRHFLQSRYGVLCQALTPEETKHALQERTPSTEFAEKMGSLLEDCERAFFSAASEPDVALLCKQAENLLKADHSEQNESD